MALRLPSPDRVPDELTDIRQEGDMKGFTLLMAACAVALASTRVAAQAPTAARYSGSSDFQVFCVSCHGASAKGDGTLAGSLRKRPADLTQLAKKHSGASPADPRFTT